MAVRVIALPRPNASEGVPANATAPTDLGFKDDAPEDARLMLRALSRTIPMVEFSMDGTILAANACYLHVTGMEADAVIGRHHSFLVHPDDLDTVESGHFWETLRAGQSIQADLRCVSAGRDEIWLQATYTPVLDAAGQPFRIVQIANDITLERRHAENHRHMLEAISRSTAMIEFGLDGTILFANPAYLKIMGYSDLEIRGASHRIFLSRDDQMRPDYDTFWNRLRGGEFVQSEFCRLAKGGRPVWLQASYNPIFGPDGRPCRIMKIATDITEAVKLRQEMAHLAYVDPLTLLGNRRKFDTEFKLSIDRCKRNGGDLALLMIDIDHFKSFNDTYGHHEGDLCLRTVAEAIRVSFRRTTDLVMRFGGEEFVALLNGADAATVGRVAEKCRAAVERLKIEHRETALGIVTISIGYAMLDHTIMRATPMASTGTITTGLVTRADTALYRAKSLGRNQVSVAPPEQGRDSGQPTCDPAVRRTS